MTTLVKIIVATILSISLFACNLEKDHTKANENLKTSNKMTLKP